MDASANACAVSADDRIVRVDLGEDSIIEAPRVLLKAVPKIEEFRGANESVVVAREHRLDGRTSLLIVAAGLGGPGLGPLHLGAELDVVPISQGR